MTEVFLSEIENMWKNVSAKPLLLPTKRWFVFAEYFNYFFVDN